MDKSIPHHGGECGKCEHCLPKAGTVAGITGEGQRGVALADAVAACGYAMQCRQGREMQTGEGYAITRQGFELQEGMRGIRNDGEVWPDLIIEDVRAKKADDLGQCPDLQWRFTQGSD